jgi:hypothetical protein
VSTGTAAAPHRIPRRPAPVRSRPDPRPRHLQLVDTERRKREGRRRWIVRVWALGIVMAALVGVMVHAFMAEAQLRADGLERRIATEQARYENARLALARGQAPDVVAARARRLGLVPGSSTQTVAVPGVAPGSPTASAAATAPLQAVKQVLDGSP